MQAAAAVKGRKHADKCSIILKALHACHFVFAFGEWVNKSDIYANIYISIFALTVVVIQPYLTISFSFPDTFLDHGSLPQTQTILMTACFPLDHILINIIQILAISSQLRKGVFYLVHLILCVI